MAHPRRKWLDLARDYRTPLYVYEKEKREEKYKNLSFAFKGKPIRFFYACKALSNINILKIIKNTSCGLNTVSINEVRLGLDAGFAPKNIIYTPNCVSFEEIKEAVELGVHINIDSISILEQFGNFYKGLYPVIIRFNPHIMAGGNYNTSTGHIDSKFGISIHQLTHVVRIVTTLGIDVEGIHMHTRSEAKDMTVFEQGLELMLNVAREFPNIKILDLGSGFKVPYKKDEKGTNVVKLEKIISRRIEEFEMETQSEIEVWFEPGGYLVSESGTFLVYVYIIKPTPAKVFVVVDSGFNHRIENISNPKGTERIYTIVGNLCETDSFAWDRMLNERDVFAFYNAEVYCFEMSMNYNSRCRPAEVLSHDGKHTLVRKREVFDDIQKNVIPIDFD